MFELKHCKKKDIVKLSLCQQWSPLETFTKLFFLNYTFFYCVVRNYRASFVKYMKSLKVSW